MPTLQKLLSDVEDYYQLNYRAYLRKKAQVSGGGGGFSMPDDPEEDVGGGEDLGKYPELIDMSRQVSDPGLASELFLLAEMYRQAIEMGGGYHSINKAIGNLINTYMEEDTDEDSGVEDLLNEVAKDLRTRAGGAAMLARPDNPEMVAQLKQLRDNFNREALEEEAKELAEYEQPSMGQMSPEDAAKGSGKGWHTVNTQRKDWSASYENERLRYIDMLAQEKDPAIAAKLKQLIEVLEKLRDQVVLVNDMTGAQAAAPDPDTAATLEAAQETLSQLRLVRRNIKYAIRNHELEQQKNQVDQELVASRDPKERFRLEQEAALLELQKSTDRGKTQEINWRKLLLKAISGGNWVDGKTMEDLLDKIQEASKLRVSREAHLKETAARLKAIKESGNFDGLVIRLKQHLPNIKMGDKKTFIEAERDRIIGEAAAAENTTYKPLVDAIVAARRAKNKAAEKQALSALYNALSKLADGWENWKQHAGQLEKSYEGITAWRKQLEALSKSGLMQQDVITEQQLNQLRTIQKTGMLLVQNGVNYGLRQSTMDLVLDVCQSLYNAIRYFDEQLKLTKQGGTMNRQQRRAMLKQMEKKALLDTSATAVIDRLMNDPAMETLEPEEYAHQVFEQLLDAVAGKMR